jgi:hypothetical protein
MESPLKCPSPILRDAPVDDLGGLLVFRRLSDYKFIESYIRSLLELTFLFNIRMSSARKKVQLLSCSKYLYTFYHFRQDVRH